MARLNGKRIVGLFIVIFVSTFVLGTVIGKQLNSNVVTSVVGKSLSVKPMNILLMGIDARDRESNSRSDTMMLASINPKTKQVAIVSIPRDTRIKNKKGYSEKINSVNYINGPEAACETASNLLDIKIDNYVVTNFEGFAKIIDVLGGVDIYVENDMKHPDPKNPELAINISKGQQHLDGHQALNYVRYRGGPTADIGRTQRQQKFIKATVKEMFKTKSITKLPRLLPELESYVHTNLPLKDIAYLAGMAKDFDSTAIVAQTLPGYPFTDPQTGASYWEVDQKTAKEILPSLLAGKQYDVIGDPPAFLKRPARVTTPQPPADPEEAINNDPVSEEDGDNAELENTEPSTSVEGEPGLDQSMEEQNLDQSTERQELDQSTERQSLEESSGETSASSDHSLVPETPVTTDGDDTASSAVISEQGENEIQ